MNSSPDQRPSEDGIEEQAALWAWRCDRGLTAEEQDQLSEWLAADSRHRAQLARFGRIGPRLQALAAWRPQGISPPNPDLLARPARKRRWVPVTLMAAAAAIAAVVFLSRDERRGEPVNYGVSEGRMVVEGARVLEDGTRVELNAGAQMAVQFTPAQRRVVLTNGEAHFSVTKNPARPFVVSTGAVDVWAVGTAFDVQVGNSAVEVLVTEGKVKVESSEPATPGASEGHRPAPVLLEARQRAIVPAEVSRPVEVATLSTQEIKGRLAWQHRLIEFTAVPLADVLAELNRRNLVQLVLQDDDLAAIRVSAAIRSDNVDGFVRLLEAGFGIKSERRGDTEILLRKRKP